MNHYYKYNADGWITARVITSRTITGGNIFLSPVRFPISLRRYDPQSQTVTTYKLTYNDDGEITGRMVDNDVAVIQVGD